jgi:hypothetical protein
MYIAVSKETAFFMLLAISYQSSAIRLCCKTRWVYLRLQIVL